LEIKFFCWVTTSIPAQKLITTRPLCGCHQVGYIMQSKQLSSTVRNEQLSYSWPSCLCVMSTAESWSC